jgi:hypothetical protein
MRGPAAAILSIALTTSAYQITVHASTAAKEDATAVLSKAAGLVDLQAPGAVPFFLLANVALREGKKSTEGVWAIAWASPGQYRSVLRFPGFTATEVVTEGAIYRQRNTESLPLMIWELQQLVRVSSAYRLGSRAKVHGIATEHPKGHDLTCVLTQTDLTDSRICVDNSTGNPFSIDRGTDVSRLENAREHSEFTDYQPFGEHSFPHKLTFRGWNSDFIEVQIQKVIAAQRFPSDEFVPPTGSKRTPFCESPESKGEIMPSTENTIPIGFKDIEVDMFFQVSPEGGVRDAQVVYSSDPLHNREILNWFVGTHFPIRTCSGLPIEYETLIRLKTGH